jgi:hypothetical protein
LVNVVPQVLLAQEWCGGTGRACGVAQIICSLAQSGV